MTPALKRSIQHGLVAYASTMTTVLATYRGPWTVAALAPLGAAAAVTVFRSLVKPPVG